MGCYAASTLLLLGFIAFAFVVADCAHEHSHSGFSDHGHVNGAPPGHHSHSHNHERSHNHLSSDTSDHVSSQQIWRDTIGSVLTISILPAIALWAIPDLDKHPSLLKILLGFAAGGLLGDAFLHLIPHALAPHSHSGGDETHTHDKEHDHSHLSEQTTVPLWVIGGIFSFLCIDKLLRFLNSGGPHKHSHTVSAPANSSGAKDQTHTKQNSVSGDEKSKKKKKSNGSKKRGTGRKQREESIYKYQISNCGKRPQERTPKQRDQAT
uniref:Zinc transporter SLC39A7 n=1 Tax=Schistocephalus solidus TaxID=70667 RepID=A0A0X3PU35_SCHSO